MKKLTSYDAEDSAYGAFGDQDNNYQIRFEILLRKYHEAKAKSEAAMAKLKPIDIEVRTLNKF